MLASSRNRVYNTLLMTMFLVLAFIQLSSSESLRTLDKHVFKIGEIIPLYSNKVGPYDNPDESYSYSDQFGFCHPKVKEIKDQNLGEHLEGDKKANSVYRLPFTETFEKQSACKVTLDESSVKKVKSMIKTNFYYEFVYDDIPVHGYVGKFQSVLDHTGKYNEYYYLYTHLQFTILYNLNSADTGYVVFINITKDMDSIITIEDNTKEFQITYSARWVKVDTPFSSRSQVYSDHFFAKSAQKAELEIHWLSILNSVVLVVLLTGFIALILMKILNRDYIRYASEDKDEAEYGWKLVAGDVFRFPPYPNLFCAIVGVGSQFVTMTVFILFLAIIGLYYTGNDGAMLVSAIVLYALTSFVAGGVSSFWFKKMEGTNWVWNVILTATVFAFPFFIMAFFVNMVAVAYNVTKALPFTSILTILLIWAFIGFPLTVIGGIAGKNASGPFQAPIRTKNFAREIPFIPWYRRAPAQMVLGGFLPFSAIYIELHYVFNSVWGRGLYQLWGILCIVFLILLIVTSCTTVTLTYFQLSMEDYRWWWQSFMTGGSIGFFIFAYSIYYYCNRSKMTGFLQASFYFGYQGFICYFFFLMLGSVGFFSTYIFVKRIYKNLHTD